jgi:hypothetical protein
VASFNEHLFHDAEVIDSSGQKYKILNYEKVFSFKILLLNILDFTLDLFMRSLDNWTVWTNFDLSEPKRVSFQQVKSQLSELVNSNPAWFKKINEDHDTIDEKLESYGSLEDLILSLAGYPD